MRIKTTLGRPGDSAVDVVITCDATARVTDVADALFRSDPRRDGSRSDAPLTLRALSAAGTDAGRVLRGDLTMLDAGIRSGDVIELARDDTRFGARDEGGVPAAMLRVLVGPDAGREFPLPFGASIVGRDRDVDVRLSDPLVSKHHARMNVNDVLEIVDLNSANGVVVGGETRGRATVTGSDLIELGDTTLCVVPLRRATEAPPATPVVEFVRSPRIVPHYEANEFVLPKPPQPPQRGRLPWVAIAAPLVMGAVFFATTHQLLAIVSIAMSPILVIGSYLDQRSTAKRQAKADRARFAGALTALQERVDAAQNDQRAVLLAQSPALTEVLDAARRLGPLLWSRRPDDDAFLSARIGVGTHLSLDGFEPIRENDAESEWLTQLSDFAQRNSSITGVPATVQLRACGAFGIAGERAGVDAVARSIVAQLIGLHSPAHVVVAGFLTRASRASWEWLRWLPHTSSPHSPLACDHLTDNRAAANALLAQLESLIEVRADNRDGGPVVPAVVVLVEDGSVADRGRLTRLAENGPAVGVHVLWCASDAASLPSACRSYAVPEPGQSGGSVAVSVFDVAGGTVRTQVAAEPLDTATAHAIARSLAPVVDIGSPVDDQSDLPDAVPYVELAGRELLSDAAAVVERWRENGSLGDPSGARASRRRKDATLRAVVGHSGSEPFTLDLRSQGPHALVGGTTGAGKSEFLQSWVLGMAATHSPERLTFLFVDYKGGSAFADCLRLPHTVGLVTDLSPHLVRRALTSLRAELRYREHLLARKKVKDLVSLEKTGDPETPPSLVIIVDEFAALVTDVPDFVDGVVDVAQRGRSLGLHLILATQRPAGVIKENLRANTNLRIALRMADEDDSADILGDVMAAHFDSSTPGRGAAKSGPGRLTTFQAGYAGGRTTQHPPAPRIGVQELDFGGGVVWDPPRDDEAETEPGPTDIARIVDTIRRAASSAAVPEPRKPWLGELAAAYDLTKLPGQRTDERLLIGVLDDPETQAQPTVFYEPDRDGNMAVYGTGGSGKSTALRSLAVSAAITPRGGPVVVYGLDFGAKGLHQLDGLPHVGGIIDGDDDERVVRLLRMLRDTVNERAVRYGAASAGSIGEYRRIAERPDEPRILLLIDGIGAFRDAYEYQAGSNWFTTFAQIAADGRPLGVHVVVSAERPNSLPASIASTVQKRLVLRLAAPDDYLLVGIPADVLGPASPPGRGMLDGAEVQVAVAGGNANVAIQSRELRRLASSMQRRGVVRPPEVLRLPEEIRLDGLPALRDGRPVIGVADSDLLPIGIDSAGAFMLTGPTGSGRTTALATIATALQRGGTSRVVFLSPLGRPGAVSAAATASGADDVAELAARLEAELTRAETASGVAVLVEAVTEFGGTAAEFALDSLFKTVLRGGGLVVGEAEASAWSGAWTLAGPFKAAKRGLLLAPGEADGDLLFGTPLGRIRRADFPPGRGFLIERGRATKVQVAR